MAVGKSAIGRNLAKRLHRRFVDLDVLIEKTEGMKVREIFAQKGENYFRQLEKRVLDDVLRREGQVIATGGGVVMDDENLHWLRARALLVGLTASIDILLTRAGTGAKRPLLQGVNRKERIETLLKEREPRYAQAHAFERFNNADNGSEQADERRAAGNRAENPEMFFQLLVFLEHRFSGDAVGDFQAGARIAFQDVQKYAARRRVRVLLADRNGQIPLSFLNRFENRFRHSQGDRANISERP